MADDTEDFDSSDILQYFWDSSAAHIADILRNLSWDKRERLEEHFRDHMQFDCERASPVDDDTETTHTPGPWKAEDRRPEDPDRYDFVVIRDDELSGSPWNIASVHNCAPEHPDDANPGLDACAANARLIAAAPELLTAARMAKAFIEKYTEEYDRIPKARGREAIVHLNNVIDKATSDHAQNKS